MAQHPQQRTEKAEQPHEQQQQHDRDAGHEHHHAHEAPAHPAHQPKNQDHEAMGHGAMKHGVDHSGHEQMFRSRFWVCLVLSIPVLLYSPTLQAWLGFTMPTFPGSTWLTPVFAVIIFAYGGVPFLQMAVP
ncbi:MAG: hypothetical protein KDE53_30355, partial [Caldilineaceae bacterium]|nr:hypothetical protein [Caldilineaceae bacterium]